MPEIIAVFMFDEYLECEFSDGKFAALPYRKADDVRRLCRKVVNVAVTDASAHIFSGELRRLPLGKRICYLESIEFSSFSVTVSANNRRLTLDFKDASLLGKMYFLLKDAILKSYHLLSFAVNGVSVCKKIFYEPYGKNDNGVCKRLFAADYEELPVTGQLYSLVFSESLADCFVINSSSVHKILLPEKETLVFKILITGFIEKLGSYLSAEDYRHFLFASSVCLRCGVCCKVYAVEVNPFEQELIAAHRNMSEDDFIEAFLEDNLFSWNEYSRCMRKAEGACVFLSESPDGRECAIYDLRPMVCRKYYPSLGKCPHAGKEFSTADFIANIASFELFKDSCAVSTVFTRTHSIPPIIFDFERFPQATLELEDFFVRISAFIDRGAFD